MKNVNVRLVMATAAAAAAATALAAMEERKLFQLCCFMFVLFRALYMQFCDVVSVALHRSHTQIVWASRAESVILVFVPVHVLHNTTNSISFCIWNFSKIVNCILCVYSVVSSGTTAGIKRCEFGFCIKVVSTLQ